MTMYSDEKRIVFEFSTDDSLCAAISYKEIHIEIDEPWCGDTETGFGATTSIYLTPKQAAEFGFWLLGAALRIDVGVVE